MFSCFLLLFFFSSRRRHTRSKRDWSSDVCSSDLDVEIEDLHVPAAPAALGQGIADPAHADHAQRPPGQILAQVAQIGRASCRERVESSVVAGSYYKRGCNDGCCELARNDTH